MAKILIWFSRLVIAVLTALLLGFWLNPSLSLPLWVALMLLVGITTLAFLQGWLQWGLDHPDA